YKGKVYGYSRSEFIVDDTLYYVVKRVKGTIEEDICEVSDEEIIAYNFRGKLDKGIKVTSIFRRNQNDSTWYLDGTWKTNSTKKYYSVTGKVNLAEEKDLTASKIFPHLEELNLADGIAFYKERKETPSTVRYVKPEKIKTEYSTKLDKLSLSADVAITVAKPNLERAEASPVPAIAATETSKPNDAIPIPTDANTAIASTENKDQDVTVEKKPIAEISSKEIKKIDAGSVSLTTPPSDKKIVQHKIPVATATSENNIVDVAPTTAANNVTKEKAAPVVAKNNVPIQPGTTVNIQIKTELVAKSTVTQQAPVVVKQTDNKPKQTQTDTKSAVKTNNPVPTKSITETKKQEVVSTTPVKTNAVAVNIPVQENKEVKPAPVNASVIPETKKPAVDILAKSAVIAGRKSEFSQVVSFKSDSLELSLYDNGEIDGDTVSVFMNGEEIMAKQGLKGSAIKKTIYIIPGNEDFTLVLFAENLGRYPPNTGLLVVHDGEDVYNLRFSSDFQKSTGIVFRRKK
ncbi:MAG: hypothetical protein WBA96_10185, partial [Chitinophagaceae bacterium]